MKLIMSDRAINLETGENKEIKYIDLSSMKIANCVGCFGCWTKMGKVMILNGSPRAPKSNSKKYSEIFMKYSRLQCDYFNITKSNHLKLIAEMENYSDVIIVFPWRKFFGQFTLQRRKKLPKTVYRLTFIHSNEAGDLCIRHKG